MVNSQESPEKNPTKIPANTASIKTATKDTIQIF
jgi:hypothetical protein